MKRVKLFVALFCFLFTTSALAADPATPEEIYENVLKGVKVLQALGAEGLPAFNDPKGEFVWKDTYVQVYECDASRIVGQINPALRQWTPEKFHSIVDKKGNRITKMICDQPYQVSAGIYDDSMSLEELTAISN